MSGNHCPMSKKFPMLISAVKISDVKMSDVGVQVMDHIGVQVRVEVWVQSGSTSGSRSGSRSESRPSRHAPARCIKAPCRGMPGTRGVFKDQDKSDIKVSPFQPRHTSGKSVRG